MELEGNLDFILAYAIIEWAQIFLLFTIDSASRFMFVGKKNMCFVKWFAALLVYDDKTDGIRTQ